MKHHKPDLRKELKEKINTGYFLDTVGDRLFLNGEVIKEPYSKPGHKTGTYMFSTFEPKPQTFQAYKWDGDYDNAKAAVEAVHAGASDSFVYTEHGDSLSFTDANGNTATLGKGDYFVVANDESGAFKGLTSTLATIGDNAWQPVSGS